MTTAERDEHGNIDMDAIKARGERICENATCHELTWLGTAVLSWLQVNSPTMTHWFCSWGCLRDYCNATVAPDDEPSDADLERAKQILTETRDTVFGSDR